MLVVVSICALTISLATRYSGLGSEVPKTVSVVKSQSQQSQRQRLLGNGLHWIAPAPSSTFFRPPRASVHAVSAVFTAIHLDSESWLYKRPPPYLQTFYLYS
jgi:hypothetical protein